MDFRKSWLLFLLMLVANLVRCESQDDIVVLELLKMGQVYETKKCYKGAIRFYQRVLKRHPDTTLTPLLKFRIGNCFSEIGAYEEALSTYEEIVKKYPNSEYAPQAYLKEGWVLAKLGRYDESLRIFDEFIKNYPNHEKLSYAFYMKARVLGEKWMQNRGKRPFKKDHEILGEVLIAYKNFIRRFPQDELTDQAFEELQDIIRYDERLTVAEVLLLYDFLNQTILIWSK